MMKEVIFGLIIFTPIILIVSYILSKGIVWLMDSLVFEWDYFTSRFITDDNLDWLDKYVGIFVFIFMMFFQYWILYLALCFSIMIWGD